MRVLGQRRRIEPAPLCLYTSSTQFPRTYLEKTYADTFHSSTVSPPFAVVSSPKKDASAAPTAASVPGTAAKHRRRIKVSNSDSTWAKSPESKGSPRPKRVTERVLPRKLKR